jgi:hypothetical protein
MRRGFWEGVSDTRVVQILLGHAGIATTATYTHLTESTRISLKGISRQADERPLIPEVGRDRDCGRLLPLRGRYVLDNYGSGIRVDQVQLQKIDPPTLVIDAFRDVQAAATDNDFDGFSDSYRCCSRSYPGGWAASHFALLWK